MTPSALIDKAVNEAYNLFDLYFDPKRKNRIYHFAFIFKRKRIIAIGMNKPTKFDSKTKYFGIKYNIPKYKKYCYAHAEIDAISKCWGKTLLGSNHTLIVIRINKKRQLCNSKPCVNCQKILNEIALKQIWWSNNEGIFCNNTGNKYTIQNHAKRSLDLIQI